jgi:hypothetical protein
MDDVDHNEIGSTTPVSITVLSVIPMRAGKLFALASVEIEIDGSQTGYFSCRGRRGE